MKEILLIMTGGTIGSSEKDGIISADNDRNDATRSFREKYKDERLKNGNEKIHFTCVKPYCFLSENLNKTILEYFVNYLLKIKVKRFSGVIIAHGSDTLTYSSAFLAMALRHFPVPLIITASNYIPSDPRSNCADNINAAVTMIETVKRGIFTVYQNPGDDFCSVFLPTRMIEADRFNDRFSSPEGHPFGIVRNCVFEQISGLPSMKEIEAPMEPVIRGDSFDLLRDIFMIRPNPVTDYSSITLRKSVAAVLHTTYHSSTASTDPYNSAYSLLVKCREENIPFYLASLKNHRTPEPLYETTHTLIDSGAVPMYDITDESALAKLLIVYNSSYRRRDELLGSDLYFETVPRYYTDDKESDDTSHKDSGTDGNGNDRDTSATDSTGNDRDTSATDGNGNDRDTSVTNENGKYENGANH